MLDVLDANAVGAPDEHGAGVCSIDDVVDDAELLGLFGMFVGGVDEHRQVVQQRLFRIARVAGMEFDVGTPDLDARMTFAYVMNRMGEGTTGDLRAARILMAVYGALAAA